MKSSLTVSSIVGIERQGSFKEGEVFGAGLNPFTLFVGVITYSPDKIITTIERTEIGLLSLDAFGQASSTVYSIRDSPLPQTEEQRIEQEQDHL